MLYCGNYSIFWDQVGPFLEIAQNRLEEMEPPLGDEMINFYQLKQTRDYFSYRPESSDLLPWLSLTALLSEHRLRLAKDPRDKIYALLGMAAEEVVEEIKIDYKSPWQDVYRDATRSIITCHGYLYILCLVEPKDNHDGIPDLPSWVPDFRSCDPLNFHYQSASEVQAYLYYMYFSASTTKAQVRDTGSPNELALQAIYIGEISRLTEPTGNLDGDVVIDERVLDGGEWAEFAASCAIEGVYGHTGEEISSAYLVLRTVDLIQRIHGLAPEQNCPTELVENLSLADNVEMTLDDVERVSNIAEIVTDNVGRVPDNSSMVAGYTNEVASGILFATTRGRMFVTDTGYLSLAHRSTAAGDKVFIVLGAPTPLILRPQKASEDVLPGDVRKYTLMGEAYVHGIMDGEALCNARVSKDPNWGGADWCWLEGLEDGPYPFDTEEVVLI